MRNSKRERGGIFLLLIRNYVIFSVVILLIGVAISYAVNVIYERSHDIGSGLSEKDKNLLISENFDDLNVKLIAGKSGIIEVLDENNNIIYSSSNGTRTYTERELSFIPDYNEEAPFISLYEFKNEEGKSYKMIISTYFSFNEEGELINNSENSWSKVLDENLNVIYTVGSNSDGITSYTEKEINYLNGKYSKGHTFYKYSYFNKDNKLRTVIVKERKIDLAVAFRDFDRMSKVSFGAFFMACIICVIVFGVILKRKVQKPLKKLNRAMQLLSEGKDNEPIVYSGPKEFVEICDSFNIMVNKLESTENERDKLIKDKQSMLADISHDLKTPITTIQGYAKALADGVIDEVEYRKYFNIIYNKSKRLTELINIFHEYSKLEHPNFKLVLEQVDLAEYLRIYVAGKYDDILENGFNIDVDIPEEILECKIDKVQFQRVLDNLLGNILKHNPPDTNIYISVEAISDKLSDDKLAANKSSDDKKYTDKKSVYKKGADKKYIDGDKQYVDNGTQLRYKIIIEDDGVGIPSDIRDNIFSPFIVGDESRNTKQGSGLGLAVTKTIVEMHGGKITLLESKGTKFEIKI